MSKLIIQWNIAIQIENKIRIVQHAWKYLKFCDELSFLEYYN